MSKTKQKSKRPEYQDSLEKLLGVSISSQYSYPTSHGPIEIQSNHDEKNDGKENDDFDLLDDLEITKHNIQSSRKKELIIPNVSILFKRSNVIADNDLEIEEDMKLISSDDNCEERLQVEIKETQEKIKPFESKYGECDKWDRGFPWDDEIDKANRDIFHNSDFKIKQREIINAVKAKRDTIALIPTGHGKSLTFQLPAVTDKGVSIIIMPLVSIIEDQVQKLKALNVEAVYVHSSNDMSEILKSLKDGIHKIKLFFLTPEQLMNNESLQSVLQELYRRDEIERFVIDEVHCMLSWGKDFRYDYIKLVSIRGTFPNTPILCLTATATEKMISEIKDKLLLKNLVKFQISFNRNNLYYKIVQMDMKERRKALCDMLLSEFKNLSGIIYTSTIKDCEELCSFLKFNMGISCGFYHAKMELEKRNEIQRKWKNDEVKVIVATIAFGMGIDKKDVRFVIHMSLPKSLIGYIQECGRAGRDGELSKLVAFYDYKDRSTINWFIKNNEFSDQARENENLLDLYSMLNYAEERLECRRVLQLKYLSEEFKREDCKMMCDNCKRAASINSLGQENTKTDIDTESNQLSYSENFKREAVLICEFLEECIGEYHKKIHLKYLLSALISDDKKKNK